MADICLDRHLHRHLDTKTLRAKSRFSNRSIYQYGASLVFYIALAFTLETRVVEWTPFLSAHWHGW